MANSKPEDHVLVPRGFAPTLTTERLTLRHLRAADHKPYARMLASPDFMRFLGPARPVGEAWLRTLAMSGMWSVQGHGLFAVEYEGRFVGNVVLGDFQRTIEPSMRGVEAAWVFDESVWGRGIASEAVAAMLGWSDRNGVGLISCVISPENAPSLKLAARAGFEKVGERELDGPVVYLERPAAA
ncbi:MAG: GNAT family protein [Pacificimonas sp.]